MIKTLLKISFVSVLFWFLYQKGFISIDQTRRALTEHTSTVLLAMGMLGFTALLGAVRWQWLLRAQGIELKFRQTLQLTFIGNFFNIALPGAVSGDFVKAFYVANAVQGRKGQTFGTILFDRVVGLSALVLVAAGALALDLTHLRGTPLMDAVQTMMIAAAVVVLAFYSYLLLMREHHDPLLALFRALERKAPKAGALTRIYESIRHYHNHRWTVVKVLLISALVHLMVGFACVQFISALDVAGFPQLPVFVVVPLGLLVTAIPIAPAGVGTGHYAFLELFKLLGTERGADVFSLYAMVQLTIGAIGGLVYLRYKGHAPRPSLKFPSVPANT